MKILMLTSEAEPFAKTGGLGDVVPALATALYRKGHDVRILMPRYLHIDRESLERIPSPLGIPMGSGEMRCTVYKGVLPNSGVPIFMLDREDLFGRNGLYGPDGSRSWPDNALRFAFLSAGVFQFCRSLNWIPDILHLHDWHSGPAAWLLKNRERKRGFANTASVLTVHNLGYQGTFPESELRIFQSESSSVDLSGMLRGRSLNFLATGLGSADQITTVSPSYAKEILTDDFSEGLSDILQTRSDRLSGILNGIDYDEWNPSTDRFLAPNNYDYDRIEEKKALKARLQREMGLPVNPNLPLFGMIGRLTGQKGIDLFTLEGSPAMQGFREGQAQLVVLGSGEQRYQDAFIELSKQLSQTCAVKIAFSGPLSRLIEAGSDFFLMPSRYEPCGLNQLYSLRYGTLPVVRRTGGLADTVIDLSEKPRRGTGFCFTKARAENFADAITRAILFYNNKKAMGKAMKRAMKLRFDWTSSSTQYLKVYRRALQGL